GDCRRFSSRNAIGLLTASDVDVPDIAAIIDVASPRQVGRGIVTVTERAIGADAVRAVAVIGIATAARETVDAHSPAGRSLSGDAEDAPIAGGRNADQRSEDRAKASAVGQPVLNRRRALRRGDARVHAVGAVTVVAVIAVIRIILRRGGRRSGNRGDPGRAGQHFTSPKLLFCGISRLGDLRGGMRWKAHLGTGAARRSGWALRLRSSAPAWRSPSGK